LLTDRMPEYSMRTTSNATVTGGATLHATPAT